MIVGNAEIASFVGMPTISAWSSGPVTLGDVTCFQLIAEVRRSSRLDLLPPGLHPTDPSTLSIQAWNVGASPWGAFAFVFSRLSCRSGLRARGLTTAAVATTDEAVRGLAETYGFPCRLGNILLVEHYDAVDLDVDDSLSVRAVDSRPLGLDDVQYTGTMNLAQSPNGLRLVQVEADHSPTRVQRLRGRIDRFDANSWGDGRLDPYEVVASTVATETSIVIPAVRFVCRPDVSAFQGTEKVG
jgi:hypothetical protein